MPEIQKTYDCLMQMEAASVRANAPTALGAPAGEEGGAEGQGVSAWREGGRAHLSGAGRQVMGGWEGGTASEGRTMEGG